MKSDKEELLQALSDDLFVKKLAFNYTKEKDLFQTCLNFAIEQEVLEEVFLENDEIKEKFDSFIDILTMENARRKLQVGMDIAIQTLMDYLTNAAEEKYAYQSAATLVNTNIKLQQTNKPPKGGERDALDDLWDMVEKGDSTTKNP